jgi:uncharacterized membrane protein YbhN (UPF0104 family)
MVETEFKPRRRPAWLLPIVHIEISLAPLISLAMQLNARQIGDAMLHLGVGTITLGPAFIFAILVPMAQRWQAVIAGDRHRLSFVNVWSRIIIGMFFNQVLPISIGGNVVVCSYHGPHRRRSAASGDRVDPHRTRPMDCQPTGWNRMVGIRSQSWSRG